MNYDGYALRRDANTVAKFVQKVSKWNEDYAYHTVSNGPFPKPISKNAKWPAYEAASRIERTLKLDTRAQSVPDLAELVAKALREIQQH